MLLKFLPIVGDISEVDSVVDYGLWLALSGEGTMKAYLVVNRETDFDAILCEECIQPEHQGEISSYQCELIGPERPRFDDIQCSECDVVVREKRIA